MTLSKGNFAINSILLTNIIFGLFPLSFIAGNLITNINFFLFCCLGIFHLKSKNISNKINFPIKVILIFFLLVLFSTILNLLESLYYGDYKQSDLSRVIKSVLFFRFFIILGILYLLSEFDIINYKYFFLSASILPILISADIIFQFFFGYNFIGIKSHGHHNTSFFGDELIAGGYIQNFSFYSILFFSFLLGKYKNLYKNLLNTFLICFLATGILLSANKMPFILFLLGLFLLFVFSKERRKIILLSSLLIFFIFGFIRSIDDNLKYSYNSFYSGIYKTTAGISKNIKNNFLDSTNQDEKEIVKCAWRDKLCVDPEADGYKKLFFTSVEIWKTNKIFGNGIKSFRIECHKVINEKEGALCSNHPHNYYLEILVDLGAAGLFLVTIIALIFFIFLIKNYKLISKNNLHTLFLLASVINIFLQFFPIKSTGSIFTTNNATYIILISSILLTYKKLLKEKNFE